MILGAIFLLFCLSSVVTEAEFCMISGIVIIIEAVLTILGLILTAIVKHFDEDYKVSINLSFLWVIVAMLIILAFIY